MIPLKQKISSILTFLNSPFMKKFKYVIISVLLLIVVFTNSCSTVYSDFQDTGKFQWKQEDKKTFVVDISEKREYDLFFGMRYGTGFPFRYMKVKVSQKLPSGKEQEIDLQFMIIDTEKKYIGDPLGQIWDYEKVFMEKQIMDVGQYTYTIEHIMKDESVPAVMEIGFIVKESEIKE